MSGQSLHTVPQSTQIDKTPHAHCRLRRVKLAMLVRQFFSRGFSRGINRHIFVKSFPLPTLLLAIIECVPLLRTALAYLTKSSIHRKYILGDDSRNIASRTRQHTHTPLSCTTIFFCSLQHALIYPHAAPTHCHIYLFAAIFFCPLPYLFVRCSLSENFPGHAALFHK